MLKPSVHQTPMNTKKRERTESIIVVDDEEDGKQEVSEEKKVVVVQESKKPAGRPAAMDMKIPMILSNLPVKSLLRFRLVCKQWNNLIKYPNFIQRHLRKSLEKAKFKLLIKPCGHESFASVDYYRDSLVSPTVSYKPSDLHNPFDKFEVHTFSSVNGLVFLEGICLEKDNLCLWNPATKEYKMVAKPKVEESVSTPVLYAFGYAANINDYKIVRARKCYKKCGNAMVCIGCQVLVYSLRADSWKKPRHNCIPYDIHMYDNIDKYVHSFETEDAERMNGLNGKIFWKATRCNVAGSVAVIIGYNTGDDTFKEIPVSPDVEVLIREGVVHRNLLGIMEGKLCIMNRHLDGTIDIWRMDDIETKRTWKKWCVIGRRNARKSLMQLEKPSFMKPIWDFKNGEVLFLENYSSLVVVDMKRNKRIRVIKIRGVNDENWLRAVPYFESLVPLNSGKYVEGRDQSLKGMKTMKSDPKEEEETNLLISAIQGLVTGNHKRMKVENI